MNLIYKLKKNINPFFLIALSFLILLIIGSLILWSPISLQEGVSVSYIDSLFTTTTSLCVTGLVSIKEGIGDTYNLFGRIFICILIQIGGLGVMTFVTLFFVTFRRRLKITEQTMVKENWNLSSLKQIRKIFYYILAVVFTIETIGAILSFFSFYFIHDFPLQDAIGISIFHSISAFNNAGIDILGPTSLINYSNDHYLLFITSLLIILGGIGYFVIVDVVRNKFRFKRLSLHTKVAISYTLFLIIFGTLVIYITELFNSVSVVSAMDAYFLSVSARTAGFTSVDLYTVRNASLIIICLLMFIGASSGGSGGGIKVTTFAIFIAYMRSLITGKPSTLFKRNLRDDLIKKAMALTMLGFSFFLLGLFLISAIEGNRVYVLDGVRIYEEAEGALSFTTIDFAFEAMSAFGTVGLTTGFTPYFYDASKLILICLMYIGRVGPMTISIMFKPRKEQLYRYVSEDISVG